MKLVIPLDKLNPLLTSCAYNFEFTTLSQQLPLNYQIRLLNSQQVNDIFFVDNSKNCLSLQKISEIHRNYLIGRQELKIDITDRYNRSDSKLCNIYMTDSCNQRINVYSALNNQIIKQNITNYMNYLSKISSEKTGKHLTALNSAIFSYPNNESESITTVLFYDNQLNQFLTDNQIVNKLKSNLNTLSSSNFKIFKIEVSFFFILFKISLNCILCHIKESCVQFHASGLLQKIGVGITASILGFLLLLIPLILFCLLCYSFKLLKYQNNRIIMTQKIIPILEDAQSNYPNDCNYLSDQIIDQQNREMRFQNCDNQCANTENSRPEPKGFK